METNKISFRVSIFILLIFYILLTSCTSQIKTRYYQYYIGTMEIENAIIVEFPERDTLFVCPDSIIYCCNDSDWLCRHDVFPYLLVAENSSQTPTYFPQKKLCQLLYFQKGYYPFYKCKEQTNKNFTTYHFFYGLNKFECYMQAINGRWFDITDPFHLDPYADSLDYLSYGKEYRLVVRHKYNIFQILKLQIKYKNHFDD